MCHGEPVEPPSHYWLPWLMVDPHPRHSVQLPTERWLVPPGVAVPSGTVGKRHQHHHGMVSLFFGCCRGFFRFPKRNGIHTPSAAQDSRGCGRQRTRGGCRKASAARAVSVRDCEGAVVCARGRPVPLARTAARAVCALATDIGVVQWSCGRFPFNFQELGRPVCAVRGPRTHVFTTLDALLLRGYGTQSPRRPPPAPWRTHGSVPTRRTRATVIGRHCSVLCSRM